MPSRLSQLTTLAVESAVHFGTLLGIVAAGIAAVSWVVTTL